MPAALALSFLLALALVADDENRSSRSEAAGPPDTTFTAPLGVLGNVYRRAVRAAEMDPGILIFADTTRDYFIRQLPPPADVDPRMIVPAPARRDSVRWRPPSGRRPEKRPPGPHR